MFMKIIDQFSRFFVGGLFIFSGLIKLNDPIGTEIKMEEYFEVFSQDFGSFFSIFIPYALEIGMIMIVLELALGFAILLYYRFNLTTWILLLLMIFFTFLTGYSAILDKVTDCGCFGDAIKLTPWQSFWKDIILMVFVLHLFWHRRRFTPVLRTREGHAVIGAVVVVSTYLGIYAINHLPFIDFRAYKVGDNIVVNRQPPEAAIGEYVFKKDGKEIKSDKFLPAEEGYEYVAYKILNEDAIKPKITDFAVTNPENEDITEYVFHGSKLIIVIADVTKASTKNIEAIRDLTKKLDGKVDCFVLTSSPGPMIEEFRHENQLAVPYYFTDATVLKTIIRSNPGIALWKDATVKGNWHHNETPTAGEVLQLLQ